MSICLRPTQLLIGVILFAFLSVGGAQTPGRFDGVRITVGVPDSAAIGGPARAHARSWELRTGGRVEVIATPFDKLFETYMNTLQSGRPRYDVMLYASAWTGDYQAHLAELPARVIEDESLDDVLPIYRDRLMTWDGRWIAVTVDGDLYSGYYRKDLFEDVPTRAEFRNHYGYELEPPDTWSQYRDVAEFFTGRVAPDGTILYGTSEPFARGGHQIWDVFSRVSAYTNHPQFPGAQFFDPDTMRPQVNNPGWVRAVEEYMDIQQYCPAGAEHFDVVQAREAFLSGRTAMVLDWGNTAQNANDPAYSRVHGKVGYFVLPGSTKSFNARTWQWDDMNGLYKAPFLAFGGWVASVPESSRHQDAAWDFIMWFGSPENSLRDVMGAGTGINPYRLTHFANIDAWNHALSKGAASAYLRVLRESLGSPNVALNLRIPGFHRYTRALKIQFDKALHQELPLTDALDRAAAAWNEITLSLGLESQRLSYRKSMGLPPQPAGPRPGAGKGKTKLVIGFSQATTTEPWRLLFNKELRDEAVRHPEIELLVRDGLDDAAKQSADVREMIALGVDAILLSPKVAEGLTAVVSEAFEAGIPVFVLDRDVANDRYAQFIGGDNREIGRAAGRYAVAHLGGSGQAIGKVIEIWGGMASTPARDRHAGFVEIVEREPGIEILNAPQDGDWKQDQGYEIMADALDRYPSIDLVYAHNDPMAHGAYLAAQDARHEAGIAFLGIDGIPAEGVRWVDEGILTATFLYKTPGEEAVRQALRYLNGETTPRRLTLPTMTIDRSNAAAILERHGLN